MKQREPEPPPKGSALNTPLAQKPKISTVSNCFGLPVRLTAYGSASVARVFTASDPRLSFPSLPSLSQPTVLGLDRGLMLLEKPPEPRQLLFHLAPQLSPEPNGRSPARPVDLDLKRPERLQGAKPRASSISCICRRAAEVRPHAPQACRTAARTRLPLPTATSPSTRLVS